MDQGAAQEGGRFSPLMVAAITVILLAGMLFGYDQGVISGALSSGDQSMTSTAASFLRKLAEPSWLRPLPERDAVTSELRQPVYASQRYRLHLGSSASA